MQQESLNWNSTAQHAENGFPRNKPVRKPLRNYQKEALTQFLIWYHTDTDQTEALIALATGMGKTLTASACIRNVLETQPTGQILWVTHRDELVQQTGTSLKQYTGKDVETEKAHQRAWAHAPIIVASVQTLKGARLEKFARKAQPLLLVFDEAHHSLARTWMDIKLQFPQAKVLNLTATPFRADIGSRLNLGKVLIEKSTSEGIAMKYLVPPHPVGTLKVNLGNVGIRLGDYKQEKLSQVLMRPEILKQSASLLQAHIPARRGIVFSASVEHGQALATEMRKRGIPTYEVYGHTPQNQRQASFKAVQAQKGSLLVNNLVCTEGLDIPELDLVAIFRPTKSAALYIQMLGRGLRTAKDKHECLVIDAVDTAKRAVGDSHIILPTDEDVLQASTLAGKKLTPADVLLSWFHDREEVRARLKGETKPFTRSLKGASQLFNALFPPSVPRPPHFEAQLRKTHRILTTQTNTETAFRELAQASGCRHMETLIRILQQNGWVYCPQGRLPGNTAQLENEQGKQDEVEQPSFNTELLTALEPRLKNFLLDVLGSTDDLGEQASAYYDTFPMNGQQTVWFRPPHPLNGFHYFTTKEQDPPRTLIWVRTEDAKLWCFTNRHLEGLRLLGTISPEEFLKIIPSYHKSCKWAQVPMTEAQFPHVQKILKMRAQALKKLKISKLSASALMSTHFHLAALKKIPMLLRIYAKA